MTNTWGKYNEGKVGVAGAEDDHMGEKHLGTQILTVPPLKGRPHMSKNHSNSEGKGENRTEGTRKTPGEKKRQNKS